MKQNWKVYMQCGIGAVTHSHIHAETEEEAMQAILNILDEWPDYMDHAGGLIKVLYAIPWPY